MKIVKICGGLASQMEKYANYVFLENYYQGTSEQVYATTYPLDFDDIRDYELKRVFNIDADYITCREITDCLNGKSIEQVKPYMDPVTYYIRRKSKDFLPTYYCTSGFSERVITSAPLVNRIKRRIRFFMGGYNPNKKELLRGDDYQKLHGNVIFDEIGTPFFTEDTTSLKNIFKFPELTDARNIDISSKMYNENSCAIHIRRGDHLYDNNDIIERGYYKTAVDLVKSVLSDSTFYIFSDDIEWCKSNIEKLGLTSNDDVNFIDWNTEDNSYIDMQLMTYCKNYVLASSGFSYWGMLLCQREPQIVCSPKECSYTRVKVTDAL